MVKLLFVEDSHDYSIVIQNELQKRIKGYEVKLAYNGKEGLDLWKKFRPDIIVSDVYMPVMDGLEMVRSIRKSDENIPIIFVSGLDTSQNVLDGYKAGVNNYIKKPYTPEELDAHIKSVLKMMNGHKFNPESKTYDLGNYTFYAKNNMLIDNKTDKRIILPFLESELLHILIKNKNEVVSNNYLTYSLWNKIEDPYGLSCLYAHIYKLRYYLRKIPNVNIRSLNKVGYILCISTTKANKVK